MFQEKNGHLFAWDSLLTDQLAVMKCRQALTMTLTTCPWVKGTATRLMGAKDPALLIAMMIMMMMMIAMENKTHSH